MSKLRVSRGAIKDLDQIWLYIAERQSVEAAESFVSFLAGKFPLLASHPGIGRSRPELGAGVRCLPVRNYRIYYRLDANKVVRILHVRHSKREEPERLE